MTFSYSASTACSIILRVSASSGKAISQWVPSLSSLAGNETESLRRALDNFEFPDQKTIIEANDRIGFDRSLLGPTDSNFRDLLGTELSLAQKSPKTHKRNADVRRGVK